MIFLKQYHRSKSRNKGLPGKPQKPVKHFFKNIKSDIVPNQLFVFFSVLEKPPEEAGGPWREGVETREFQKGGPPTPPKIANGSLKQKPPPPQQQQQQQQEQQQQQPPEEYRKKLLSAVRTINSGKNSENKKSPPSEARDWAPPPPPEKEKDEKVEKCFDYLVNYNLVLTIISKKKILPPPPPPQKGQLPYTVKESKRKKPQGKDSSSEEEKDVKKWAGPNPGPKNKGGGGGGGQSHPPLTRDWHPPRPPWVVGGGKFGPPPPPRDRLCLSYYCKKDIFFAKLLLPDPGGSLGHLTTEGRKRRGRRGDEGCWENLTPPSFFCQFAVLKSYSMPQPPSRPTAPPPPSKDGSYNFKRGGDRREPHFEKYQESR